MHTMKRVDKAQSPRHANSKTSEGLNMLGRQRASRKNNLEAHEESSTFYRMPPGGVAGYSEGQKGIIEGISLQKGFLAHEANLQILQKDNQALLGRNRQLQLENMKLVHRNRQLQSALKGVLSEISENKAEYSSTGKQKVQLTNQRNRVEDPTKLQLRCGKLSAVVRSLQSENELLIKYKDGCITKIACLQQDVQGLKSLLATEKQEVARMSMRLQELFRVHAEDQESMRKLERLLGEANGELHKLVRETKSRDEEMAYTHDKFHREMARMKEKMGKCKEKMQAYRRERDEMAIEIQRAKMEIGSVTLRKYFPEDSDD